MLILLPVLVSAITYLILFCFFTKREPAGDALRFAVVYTLGVVCLSIVLMTEGLSLISAITRPVAIIIWGTALVTLVFITWRRGYLHEMIVQLHDLWKSIKLKRHEKIFCIAIGFYLAILFLIAIIAPPNNNDSLQYHMARIVHWIQNQNLEYFPIAYLPQLFNPTGSEILLLNGFLLVGGDRLVNLLQWSLMFCSLLVVSLIAKRLGAGRLGQWLAVVFLLSLPVGILEATSTQNDYVSAFWILCLVSIVVKNRNQAYSRIDIFTMAVLAGLAMLVKVAAYPYVAVILIWAVLSKINIIGFKRSILHSVVIITVLVVLNFPGWARSQQAFHSPLGETAFISRRTPSVQTPADFLISPIQHLALNVGTPFNNVNEKIGNAIIALCHKLGGTNCSTIEPSEWGFRIIGLSNHEDSAGNLLHLVLLFTTMAVFVFTKKKSGDSNYLVVYILIAFAGFLLFSWLVTWGAYWGRLQLPLFALAAPFIGVVIERWKKGIVYALAATILICGLPWLLMNRTRPIVTFTPNVTLVRSIFIEPREVLLFANYPELQDQIEHVTSETLESGCTQISLKIDSRDPEYYFMAFLQPWKNNIEIESVSGNPLLDQYRDPDFQACAQVCSICGNEPNSEGLILAYKDKAMTLYLSPEYYAEYQKQ
jgi:hypothetical protein